MSNSSNPKPLMIALVVLSLLAVSAIPAMAKFLPNAPANINAPGDAMVNVAHFAPFAGNQADTAVTVLASCFGHLHSLVAQLEQLKAQTGAQRVAEFLLELSPCEEGSCIVTLPYDKVLIAGRLGMKPESLSRAFAKLKSVGVSISRNSATIEDVERLRDYSISDPAISWSKEK